MKKALDVMMGFSVLTSWVIFYAIDYYDNKIDWTLNDDTNYDMYLSYDIMEYIGYGISAIYFIGFYNVYKNKRSGIWFILTALIASLFYEFFLGVRVSHPVTRLIENIDWMLNISIYIIGYHYFNTINATTKTLNSGGQGTI